MNAGSRSVSSIQLRSRRRDFAQYRETIVDLAETEQRNRVPVAHLGIVADQPLGGGKFALRRIEIAALEPRRCASRI